MNTPLSGTANAIEYIQHEISSGNLKESIDTGKRGSLVTVCIAAVLAFGALVIPEMCYVEEE